MPLTPEEEKELLLLLEAEAKAQSVEKEFTAQPGPQEKFLNSSADIVLFGGAAGAGKDLDLNTPIPTLGGWTTMRDVQPGDVVFDEKGNVCNVTAISPIMFNKNYCVRFSDGSEIIAGKDHLWVTMTDKDRAYALRRTPEFRERRRAKRPHRGIGAKPWLAELNALREYNDLLEPPTGSVKTTQEIKDTLTVRNGSRINHSIDVAAPLNLPEKELPIDPYVLGVWLGDGGNAGGIIYGIDMEIFDHISNAGYTWHKQPSADIGYRVDGLTAELHKIALLHNKHIPSIYLRASFSQRLALLQGLMDTDGTCRKDKGDCEFTTTCKELADGIYELICSLGIKTNIKTGRAMLNGKDCGVKYRLLFCSMLPVFRLTRKLERQKKDGFRGTHRKRYIVAVDEVETRPTKCITVDSPSRLYLAGNSMIPTHNTRALLIEATRHIDNPRFSCVIFRHQATQITAPGGLWDAAMQILPLKKAVPKLSPRPTMVFPSKAKVVFSHIFYESDVFAWQGAELPLICWDEFTHFSRNMFLYLLSRNRSTCGVRPYMRATCNPDADSWVADFISWWIDQDTGFAIPERSGVVRYFTVVDDQFVWGDSREELANRCGLEPNLVKSFTFISANIKDNPILLEKDPGYLANLQSMGTVERERLLYGNWKIRPSSGMFFKKSQTTIVSQIPGKIRRYVRAWDLAASIPTAENPNPDFTVGLLMGKLDDGRYIILDMIRGRWVSNDVRKIVLKTARADKARYGRVLIRLPQDPAQSGKEQAQSYIKMLSGFLVKAKRMSGDKITRAEPYSSQWQAGNVLVLIGPWNDQLLTEHEAFPPTKKTGHDDTVDAGSDSFTELQKGRSWAGACS